MGMILRVCVVCMASALVRIAEHDLVEDAAIIDDELHVPRTPVFLAARRLLVEVYAGVRYDLPHFLQLLRREVSQQSTVALIVDMPHPDLDHPRRNLRVLRHREHVRLLSLRSMLDCLAGKPRYGFHRRSIRPDLAPVESDAPPAVPRRPHDAVVGVAVDIARVPPA